MPTGLGFLKEARFVAIVGSRDYPQEEAEKRIRRLVEMLSPTTTVVSGGAGGVDQLADRRALVQGLMTAVIRPGLSQAPQLMNRNTVIVRASDAVVAFWNGESPGTADTIRKALAHLGRCVVVLPGRSPEVWCR